MCETLLAAEEIVAEFTCILQISLIDKQNKMERPKFDVYRYNTRS